MGQGESAAGAAHGGGATMAKEMHKDEFRRGDRVLVLSKLDLLNDPELVAKLRSQNPLASNRAGVVVGKNDNQQAESDTAIVNVEGEEGAAEQNKKEDEKADGDKKGDKAAELPDYPRSCYGWIVLAVDYVGGIYAVQMADGSYLPCVQATNGEGTVATDLELLIRCDWTRGGVDGEKNPDSIPLSSLELPLNRQHSEAGGHEGGVVWGDKTVPTGELDRGSHNGSHNGSAAASSLGTINTKTASKTTKSAQEAKKKKMLCGARVVATTKVGKYSGIIACINSDSTYNIQADFGDYLTSMKLEAVECTEPSK